MLKKEEAMEETKTRLRHIGTSKGVILNSKILYSIDAKVGDEFSVSANKNKIVLTKADKNGEKEKRN